MTIVLKGNKNYYAPTEVEEIFNKAREEEGKFIKAEEAIVLSLYEGAKRNNRLGDKVQLVVDPCYIHIPRWQRKADLTRAKKIGEKYASFLWDVPKVIIKEGKFICIDGMHRLLGALLAKKKDVVVEIIEVDEKTAINIFLEQTKNKKRMSPEDCYAAAMDAGKEEYITFTEICHCHNVQIKGDDTLLNPVGIFASIKDGVALEPEILDKILTLIHNLGWNGSAELKPSKAPYGSKTIRSLTSLYAQYSECERAMERTLIAYCKGTDWFKRNLSGSSQYKIFDILNEIIENNLPSIREVSTNRISKIG